MESLKFVPFTSTIHPGFWSQLAKVKLEVAGLDEQPREVWGTFTNSDDPVGGLPPRLGLDWEAFQGAGGAASWNTFPVRGRIVIKNTVEAFKSENKMEFLSREAAVMWSKIADKSWIDSPEVLTSFTVLMFADLKKYLFYYWFAFPAFTLPAGVTAASCQTAGAVFSSEQLQQLGRSVRDQQLGVYSVLRLGEGEGGAVTRLPLSALLTLSPAELRSCCVAAADPSSGSFPGWSVRNLVTALATSHPHLVPGLRILCLRNPVKDGVVNVGGSLVITLALAPDTPSQGAGPMPGVVGWEKNEKGQMGPRLANMRATMDPAKIAENSVDLNLKLMKWRLVPDLPLAKVQAARCLLLGSGTLGCAVARCLLGWGVRTITLLDSGRVSHSNPVRQTLFTFQDCLADGGRGAPKAVAAAARLKEIFPGVRAQGVELGVPMPGHTATGALLDQARRSYERLETLIEEHDVIFLLMDSRESRWLPTALAALKPDKLVINAALGFDTFLVMRHGVRGPEQLQPLGCYFCNDVVAPGDSTTDRTLDQQCTVTRPGASGLAASLAAELAVSVLAHPLGPAAPAGSEGVLGTLPHTIRGSLHNWGQVCCVGPAFSQCTGCSAPVLAALRDNGWDTVKKVMDSPKYLEDLTGLTDLMSDADLMAGVIDIADDDTFSVSSGDI